MAGLAMVIWVCNNRKLGMLSVAAPPLFTGTVLFLAMMVLGLGCMCTCLAVVAAQLKRKHAIPLFVIAFLAAMGMGYAGRLDTIAAWVNWLEQGINIVSQGSLMWGVLLLHGAVKE